MRATWQTNNGSTWFTANRPPTNTATITGEVNLRSPYSVTNAASSVSITNGLYVLDAGATNAISGVTLTLGNGVANGVIRNGSVAGILAESGAGNLLDLNGSVTNSGGMVISGGTVSVTNVTTTGVQQLGSGGLTFDTGGTLLNTGPGAQTTADAITLNSGGGVITMSGPTMQLTGTISGGGGLTTGGSDLILNRAVGATFNAIGSLTVTSGRLFVFTTNSVGCNTITVQNGATVDFSTGASTTPTNVMSFASGSVWPIGAAR